METYSLKKDQQYEYPKIKKLGRGYFGEVWQVKRNPPSSKWEVAAMKVIKNSDESAWNEVDILKKLHHEFVIKYYDSFKCDNSGDLCIVMEYCDWGTLASHIGVSHLRYCMLNSIPFTEGKFQSVNHDNGKIDFFYYRRQSNKKNVMSGGTWVTYHQPFHIYMLKISFTGISNQTTSY